MLNYVSQVQKKTKLNNQGTVDDVLRDQDLEQGKDVLEEADREADLLEQIPLPGHPTSEKERLDSWLRLLRRARVAISGGGKVVAERRPFFRGHKKKHQKERTIHLLLQIVAVRTFFRHIRNHCFPMSRNLMFGSKFLETSFLTTSQPHGETTFLPHDSTTCSQHLAPRAVA